MKRKLFLLQSFKLYEARDSNRLIEEFMLLANMSVAEKLYRAFPEIAVLRMHPPPQPRSLEATMKMLRAYGEKKFLEISKG